MKNNIGVSNQHKKYISRKYDIREGGKIAKRGKKGREVADPGEPVSTGRPITFIIGLVVLLIGLFISLGSVFHNILKVFVNETSHSVYGPYDWAAAIVGALALLVGIIILMFSKGTAKTA
jgi:hypothetical protein